jgi:hypothetical protein
VQLDWGGGDQGGWARKMLKPGGKHLCLQGTNVTTSPHVIVVPTRAPPYMHCCVVFDNQ